MPERPDTAAFGLLAGELIAAGKSFRFRARGRSMSPTIQDGDTLYVEPIQKFPRIGDIVLFLREGQFKAHRIVRRTGSQFVTRGDAGMETDGIIRREEIIGRVVARQPPELDRLVRLDGIYGRLWNLQRRVRTKISQYLRQPHGFWC